jgi:hypothetical protein
VKILYLATRGEGRTPLSIEREVDMLTRMFADTLVELRALPWARAESLVRDLSTQQFDVLHITAHGEGEALQVLDEKGTTVMMSAEHILAFLPQMHKPRLIYLNACDSGPLAKQLAAQVPFAIGSTLPLGNDQAIHAALSFYWRVLLGGTIEEAFQAARGIVGLLSGKRAEVTLHEQRERTASQTRLLPKPRILAAFAGGIPKGEKKFFEVTFGIEGAPTETSQVVFFTDDESVIDSDSDEPITAELCAVARGRPNKDSALWCDRLESWDVSGDFRLFAVGVTSSGPRWTASSSLCEALGAWHSREKRDMKQLSSALNSLRRWGEPQTGKPSRGAKRVERE